MKDKEKQFRQECSLIANGEDLPTDKEMIEEMARVLIKASCKGSECEKCSFIDNVKEATECCVCLKAFYNAGYRKLPENSVVLSRELYNEMVDDVKISKDKLARIIDSAKEKASKETAEKFLQLAYDRCLEKSFIKKVEELAKQFGVEIKEVL